MFQVKPFCQWEKLDMTSLERRKLVCSVTFHVVAITCVVWSLYVLIDRTTEEIKVGLQQGFLMFSSAGGVWITKIIICTLNFRQLLRQIFRMTIQVISNLPLTLKQTLRFSTWAS